jgi:hypothetical protein
MMNAAAPGGAPPRRFSDFLEKGKVKAQKHDEIDKMQKIIASSWMQN